MVETISPRPFIEVHAVSPRAEHALLRCCSRTCVDPPTARRIRDLVEEDIDWDYLRRIASSHGVMPLLYQSLETVCSDAVPKTVLEQLQADFYVNSRHNQRMTRELLRNPRNPCYSLQRASSGRLSVW